MGQGVYIHYPYCRRRCDYCDFAIEVKPLAAIDHRAYSLKIQAELAVRAAQVGDAPLISIYVGGGTPSLWPATELAAVLHAVADAFAADLATLEVTLEANPIDCAPAALESWLEAGVNRVSVGVQSLDPAGLVTLGRDHRMGDGVAALTAIADAGIGRVSVDVILGTPGTADGGLDSLARLADFGPEHMSVYELTFEPNAPLGRAAARGDVSVRENDELAELYLNAHETLESRGYEHYEISSYARPGARAVHNSIYWRGGPYLGLGASASSFFIHPDGSGRRETNVRSAARYLTRDPSATVAESQPLTVADVATDRLWLGLRTSDGVALAALDGRPILRDWLVNNDLAVASGGRMRPTVKGFLYADRVATRVVS